LDRARVEELTAQVQNGIVMPFIQEFFVVRSKDNDLIPFDPSPTLLRWVENESNYNIKLKPRQIFSSTYHVLKGLAFCLCIPEFQAATIAHEKDATELIFQTVRRALEHMDKRIKPKVGHERVDYLEFPENGSLYYIGTAGSKQFGTGRTINYLHFSEEGKFSEESASTLLTAAQEAVPKGGYIDRESTPFGLGGTFHEGYVAAKNGESNFVSHFAPWFEHPEFFLLPESPETLPKDRKHMEYTDEELGMIERVRLTEGQIRWRRWKQQQRGRMFWQEYPEDDVTCWLSSETTVFSDQMSVLYRMLQDATEPFDEDKTMHLKIWKRYNPASRYVVAADPAGGGSDGDPSAATVLTQDGEKVARVYGQIPPTQFARIVCEVGNMYGRALVGFERNNGYGQRCLEVANDELGYPNLYRQIHLGAGPLAEGTLGWLTTDQSKLRMITAMKEWIAEGSYRTRDTETIREIMEYRRDEKTGRYGAPRGRHDDLVTSDMIGIQMLHSLPIQHYRSSDRQVSLYPMGV